MVGFLRVLISIGVHSSSSKLTASQKHQFPNQSFMKRLLLNFQGSRPGRPVILDNEVVLRVLNCAMFFPEEKYKL